ncbi:unnamed protein product [Brassica oleracea]|nr:unnamed protein product [Brassica napus]
MGISRGSDHHHYLNPPRYYRHHWDNYLKLKYKFILSQHDLFLLSLS